MSDNNNMNKAKVVKNDEFYTQLSDILKELLHYDFKGKSIYCNCDDWNISKFVTYFTLNFETLGIKKLVATCYNEGSQGYYFEAENGREIRTMLKGDGDFRSDECRKYLEECDIVVTNPPFSLFDEFITMLIDSGKQFLIIGNKNALKNRSVFPYIKEKKVWLGVTQPNIFDTPDGSTKRVNGLCRWYTNMEHDKQNELLSLTKSYEANSYSKFNEFDAINVDNVSDIPNDYYGLMGVPITFLDKYNPSQFEILDLINRYCEYDYFGVNESVRKRHSHCCSVNNDIKYCRILIRRKKC